MIENFLYYLGLVGVVCMLAAYLLLQLHKIKHDSYIYSWLNFAGAGFVLVSLFFAWNLPAALIEIAWMLISGYAIVRKFIHNRIHLRQ